MRLRPYNVREPGAQALGLSCKGPGNIEFMQLLLGAEISQLHLAVYVVLEEVHGRKDAVHQALVHPRKSLDEGEVTS